jgi:hypothetical protein
VLLRDVEVHLHAAHTWTEHFWLCVWANIILKTASLLANSIWTTGCTWLPKMSTQPLAVIQPFRVIIGPAEYQHIAAQITTDPPPCFTVGTRHSLLRASLGVWPDAGYNVKDVSPDHVTCFQSTDVQVLSSSHHLFRHLLLLLDL